MPRVAKSAADSRQAVTKLKIRGNAIPYMDTTDEINTIYCMPFVPVSYFVTVCRVHFEKTRHGRGEKWLILLT